MKYVELRYEILRSIPNITLKYPNSIKPLFYQIFTGVRILSLELGYILITRFNRKKFRWLVILCSYDIVTLTIGLHTNMMVFKLDYYASVVLLSGFSKIRPISDIYIQLQWVFCEFFALFRFLEAWYHPLRGLMVIPPECREACTFTGLIVFFRGLILPSIDYYR